ncbi:iga [Symbiodinium natans]|uniref:Iga protein n=1 Tax=Symbiodinium natans TaxID=878477 RepID=A0A812U0T7_9DINO|nr:iga [Symbiodinium natans]
MAQIRGMVHDEEDKNDTVPQAGLQEGVSTTPTMGASASAEKPATASAPEADGGANPDQEKLPTAAAPQVADQVPEVPAAAQAAGPSADEEMPTATAAAAAAAPQKEQETSAAAAAVSEEKKVPEVPAAAQAAGPPADEEMPPATAAAAAADPQKDQETSVAAAAVSEEKKVPEVSAAAQAAGPSADEEMPPATAAAAAAAPQKEQETSAAAAVVSEEKKESVPAVPAAAQATGPSAEEMPPATAAAAAAAPQKEQERPLAAAPQAARPAGEEGLFFVDAAGEAAAAAEASKETPPTPAPAPAESEESKAPEKEAAEEATSASVPTCTHCGLPGHSSSACPFAHPEDIDLGDIEESDSDDELNDLYPLFSRYVSQHVGALTPKDKRGLTGGGRYFGNEKQQAACWACAKTGHDANSCPDRGCFFCTKKGHESRSCPQRSLKCAHCGLRGHAPVSCATLAAQRLKDFSHVRCLRCGGTGHANCGPPPKAPHQPAAVTPMQAAHTQEMLRQIAAGRARAKAFNTAPWRRPAATDEPPTSKMRLSEAPVPELTVCD